MGILIVKEGLIVAFIVDAFLSQFEDNRARARTRYCAAGPVTRRPRLPHHRVQKGTKDDIPPRHVPGGRRLDRGLSTCTRKEAVHGTSPSRSRPSAPRPVPTATRRPADASAQPSQARGRSRPRGGDVRGAAAVDK